MIFTTRMLLATALCLVLAAPSPVLSFSLPEKKYADTMLEEGVGEHGGENNKMNSIAKTLIEQVFGAEEEGMGEQAAIEKEEEEKQLSPSKRAQGPNRPQREIRARAHTMIPSGRRNPVTRSKFTFGKRSPVLPELTKPAAEHLLDELQRDMLAERLSQNEKLALFKDAALYDNLENSHQVQKDAYSAFTFGKRGLSSFAFGKRGMPAFSFGKRGLSSFAFGKRFPGGSAFNFGRRNWAPEEQDFTAPEPGPYEIKRADLAFAFGKRNDQ